MNIKVDASSASEEEAEQTDDSDSNINFDLICSNCNTLAKELHQTGKDRSLLCNECRNYLKKFGEHRPVGDKESNLKSISKLDDEASLSNGKPNLRTRRSKDKMVKYELNRGSSKSSETSSPERSEPNSSENNASDVKTNGITCDNELKKGDILKRRHYSSVESSENNEFSIDEIEKEFEMEIKKRKGTSDSCDESNVEEKGEELVKSVKSEEMDSTNCLVEAVQENSSENVAEMKEEMVELIKEEPKEPSETDEVKPANISSSTTDMPVQPSNIKEEEESSIKNISEPEKSDHTESVDTEKSDIINLKMESSSSPQDLSSLSTREREKISENVPFQTSSSGALSNSSSPVNKKDENIALNFSASTNNKLSPSSSPNPLLFPFSQNPLSVPTTISERFPYLMPQMNFSATLGLPQDPSSTPQRQQFLNSSEKHEETKVKEDHSKTENYPNKSTPTSKTDSSRSLQSPKTTSASSTFPTLGNKQIALKFNLINFYFLGPFPSSDQFLMSHPNFASQLSSSGERMPFPNPLINYPPGFTHMPGLSPFMAPWSQYPARLPPGAFQSPFMQLPPNQMSSHSPHSQISKSKSPISSQSSSHHSPSHFSNHPSKCHDNNKDNFDRRDRDPYQQEDDEMDNSYLSRGPSPEPKIEDSECHRSQSAMYD